MSKLKDEIGQARPFSSVAEEALLNLLRTADCLERAMQRSTRSHGITGTQYNVLRILRGAHPQGLTCSAIGDRMITADPDITRLLSRLKAMGLIRQQRDKRDKRVVWTQISPAGLALLSELDPTVQKLPTQLLGHIAPADLHRLVELLELARQHCGDGRPPGSCDGTGKAGESACAEPTGGS
ncbi:MAG TPA: MarR family transcriptional regulator [Acidobacteriaceae bacterium]|nr:MarR family transcriptional regulator [Acidobacteriaceae bacterium]